MKHVRYHVNERHDSIEEMEAHEQYLGYLHDREIDQHNVKKQIMESTLAD